jgi:hypothetical protein
MALKERRFETAVDLGSAVANRRSLSRFRRHSRDAVLNL